MSEMSLVQVRISKKKLHEAENRATQINNAVTSFGLAGIIGTGLLTDNFLKSGGPDKVQRTVKPVLEKVTPVLGKATPVLEKVKENIKKIIELPAAKQVTSVLNKVGNTATDVGKKAFNHVNNMNPVVKIVSALALGALAISHVHRDGKIKGTFQGLEQFNKISDSAASSIKDLMIKGNDQQ